MLDRENWPYLLVVSLGLLSWIANDFVRSAREVAVLIYETDLKHDGRNPREYSLKISNLSTTKFASNFDIILDFPTNIAPIEANGACLDVSYSSVLRASTEEEIDCSEAGIIELPVNRLTPASSLAVTLRTNQPLKSDDIGVRILSSNASPNFSVLSKWHFTSLFLQYQWHVLIALALIAIWPFLRFFAKMRSHAKSDFSDDIDDLMAVLGRTKIRLSDRAIASPINATLAEQEIEASLAILKRLKENATKLRSKK
ncbi:MAG: respiratory nitrate reductase subunit gamma [Rhodospirillales bacterium]|nr:respiratory nitrate reductase subunit gamma [Rhodospirillales bacterium]